jgi:hypothetical protein
MVMGAWSGIGELHGFIVSEALVDFVGIAHFFQASGIALANGVHGCQGMSLIDGNEFRTET